MIGVTSSSAALFQFHHEPPFACDDVDVRMTALVDLGAHWRPSCRTSAATAPADALHCAVR